MSLEHLRSLAYDAYRNTSFSPEKWAESTIQEYTTELNRDLQSIEAWAREETPASTVEQAQERYRVKFDVEISSCYYLRSKLI